MHRYNHKCSFAHSIFRMKLGWMTLGLLLFFTAMPGSARAEVTTSRYRVGWISHFFGEDARTVYSAMNVVPREGYLSRQRTLELTTLGFTMECSEVEGGGSEKSYYCQMRVKCGEGRSFCSETEGFVFATYRRDQIESAGGRGVEELDLWWRTWRLPVQTVGSGFVAKILALKHPNPEVKEARFMLACRSAEESPEMPEVCQLQFPREDE